MSKRNKFAPRGTSRDMSQMDLAKIQNSPCTVAEATQIAIAAAKDVTQSYTASLNKVVIQQTILIETLKEMCLRLGATQELFEEIYKMQAEEYLTQKKEYLENLVSNRREEEGGDADEHDAETDRPE